jgi:hypothetical protein
MIKDTEIGRLLCIAWVGPKCNHKCPWEGGRAGFDMGEEEAV